MGLCGWLFRYLTQRLIPWKQGILGVKVWAARTFFVKIADSNHKRNMLYPYNSMSKKLLYSMSELRRSFSVNRSVDTNSFLYVESILKYVSTFLNFPGGNDSFTSSMMCSVWSTLETGIAWKIWQCR